MILQPGANILDLGPGIANLSIYEGPKRNIHCRTIMQKVTQDAMGEMVRNAHVREGMPTYWCYLADLVWMHPSPDKEYTLELRGGGGKLIKNRVTPAPNVQQQAIDQYIQTVSASQEPVQQPMRIERFSLLGDGEP